MERFFLALKRFFRRIFFLPEVPAKPQEEAAPPAPLPSTLKEGLAKTRMTFTERIVTLLRGKPKVDEALLEDLEEALLGADIGARQTMKLLERLRERAGKEGIPASELVGLLKEEILSLLGEDRARLEVQGDGITVIMVVGVNGTGKTSTTGKLAYRFRQEGKRVLLAASDTFRAAAIEQLEVWGRRAGVDLVKHGEGGDPAAVAYDAIQAAKSRKVDVVLVDTAGRLHTKVNLMEELKKLRRVISREVPGAPHEVLLTLDATSGQNAIVQARTFTDAVDVTGIVLTKLDGTAKGGVIIGIKEELGIPVKLIGIGEGIADLRAFDPSEFVEALFDVEGAVD